MKILLEIERQMLMAWKIKKSREQRGGARGRTQEKERRRA